jgi:hypothetical protein
MVKERKYGANTVYTCIEMEKSYLLKLFQEWGRNKGNGEGVNSSMIYLIYFKNFYKSHIVPPPSSSI